MRSRCWVSTNGRVRDRHSSRGLVVRHDGSTPRAAPTVCLPLLGPHALTPACCPRCPCARSPWSTDLCRSSARSLSLPADAVSAFDLMARWFHWRSPVGGHRGEQSDDRATCCTRCYSMSLVGSRAGHCLSASARHSLAASKTSWASRVRALVKGLGNGRHS